MENKFLDVRGVCELTGLAKQTIYAEIYKAKILGEGIPFIKFGPRLLRFDRDLILQWRDNRIETFRPMKQALAKRKIAAMAGQ